MGWPTLLTARRLHAFSPLQLPSFLMQAVASSQASVPMQHSVPESQADSHVWAVSRTTPSTQSTQSAATSPGGGQAAPTSAT